MAALDRLPTEVLLEVISYFTKRRDVAALSRTNRHLYQVANPILWKREVDSDRPGVLHWAVEHDDLAVVKLALGFGTSPGRLAWSHKPRSRIESKFKWWDYHHSYYEDLQQRLVEVDDLQQRLVLVEDDDDDRLSVRLDPSYVLHDRCGCYGEGCDEGIFNDCYWQPLHAAVSKGRLDMVKIFLDAGADIDAKSWGVCLCRPHLPLEVFRETSTIEIGGVEGSLGGGWSPLHIAICHGHTDIAKYLLDKGASTKVYQGNDRLAPRIWSLVEQPELQEDYAITAMHDAAQRGNLELMQFLWDGEFPDLVNREGPYMGTPILQAIWHRQWDRVVPWLLEHGADVDICLAETRNTPLMILCYARRFTEASKLIDIGADAMKMSTHAFSILHLLLGPSPLEDFDDDSDWGSYDEDEWVWSKRDSSMPQSPPHKMSEIGLIVKLISGGLPLDTQESLLGLTPLMVASASCNVPALQALVDGGADLNIKDWEGLTAIARVGEAADGNPTSSLFTTAKILIDAGADLNSSDTDGVPPLIALVERNPDIHCVRFWEAPHAKLAKLLVEHGADPNAKGSGHRRPFTTALYQKKFPLAEAILECGGRPAENDIEQILNYSARDFFNTNTMNRVLGLDYAKYGLSGPSDEFLAGLLENTLDAGIWSRAADLSRYVKIPEKHRPGLLHRCLANFQTSGDSPSPLVARLVEMGEDPNALWQGEPPLYFSLKSPYGVKTTQVLLDAGADISMTSPSMPDGVFMFAIHNSCHKQTLQLLSKSPNVLREKPEHVHERCWASLIEPTPTSDGGVLKPCVDWKMARKMLEAGLRTDVSYQGRPLNDTIREAIPTRYTLGLVERGVLATLGIPYEAPVAEPFGMESLSSWGGVNYGIRRQVRSQRVNGEGGLGHVNNIIYLGGNHDYGDDDDDENGGFTPVGHSDPWDDDDDSDDGYIVSGHAGFNVPRPIMLSLLL